MFLEMDEGLVALRLTKAENPFDGLAAHAIEEYRQGRRISLRGFAKELGIDLDNTQKPIRALTPESLACQRSVQAAFSDAHAQTTRIERSVRTLLSVKIDS
jgi:hypothetical protein